MSVSVVMATYNGEKYIQEQLDSIRTQSVSPDEVIICDDCSTDNTVKVVEKYITLYKLENKWKIYKNECNLGYADNFNKVAEMANGTFVLFADQDDIWLNNKIEISIETMQKYQDCQVLCTDYEPFLDGEEVPKPPRSVLKQMPNNGTLEKITLNKKSVYIRALGCCMCIRKTFLQDVEKYWFDGWAQDDRMWRLAQCADGCYLLHLNLVRHRIHGNNTSTYGKYHTVEKRIQLFENMQEANKQMLQMKYNTGIGSEIRLLNKHIEMMKLRLILLKKGELKCLIQLIRYLPYYQKVKSFLVEFYLVVKEKRWEKAMK